MHESSPRPRGRSAVSFLLLSTLAACAAGATPTPPLLRADGSLPEVLDASVFALSPIEFLDALTRTRGYWVTLLEDAPAGWLGEADVAVLEERTAAGAPCPHVLSSRARILPIDSGGTTEGEIARYMIAAVRAGRFPIDLGSADDSRLH